MKKFLQDHSYNMVKMFLNQIAIAMFGFSLAIATAKAQNVALRNATSVCAILFYLFLLYSMTWEIGFSDKVSVESGKKRSMPLKGALISLCANVINFLLAILIMLAQLLPQSFLSSIGAVSSTIAILTEGMYMGLLTNHFLGAALNSYWWVYFLLPIPAILTCAVAYQMGIHDFKISALFRAAPNVPKGGAKK
jgi:hypothetical protein